MKVRSTYLPPLWRALMGLMVALLAPMHAARAHEVRPAYLQIDEIGPGRYEVLWRTPILSGMRLPVALGFPGDIRSVTKPSEQELSDSLIERRIVEVGPEGLAGRRIDFVGLQATITDVLVRVQMRDGTHSTVLVPPSQPWVEIVASSSSVEIAEAYLWHGVRHILFGVDHLLFVFGLLLLAKDRWMLVKTITSFTIAHSITLTLATLGYTNLPTPPIEAGMPFQFFSLRLKSCEPGAVARALRFATLG